VRALSGRYLIKVRHVWGEVVGGKAVLTITRHRGTPEESVKTITVALQSEDQEVSVVLENGRREKLNPELQKSSRKVSLWRNDPRTNNFARAMQGMTPAQRQVLQQFQEDRANNRVLGVFNSAVGYAPVVRTIND